MSSYADRLAALREQLKADRLDGFVVPLTDEHMSEYVGSYAQRLAWLTGFEGSAGARSCCPRKPRSSPTAAIRLQVRSQVSADHWSYQSVPETSIADWLKEHAPNGARIGYDPWLHSRDWVKQATEALAAKGADAGAGQAQPDRRGVDRPARRRRRRRLIVHPDRLAGKSSAEKRHEIADWLGKQGADAAVLAALDSIAWTFNVRGEDVSRTPVALAYALVHADGTADLFVAGEKLDADVRQASRQWRPPPRARRFRGRADGAQGQARRRSIPSARSPRSSTRSTRRGRRSSPCAIRRCCRARSRIRSRSPATRRPRRATAPPSPASCTGSSEEAPKGGLDELKASDRLRRCAARASELRDLSFDTISGAGPNGAIVHYRASRSHQPAAGDELALSGRFGRPI